MHALADPLVLLSSLFFFAGAFLVALTIGPVWDRITATYTASLNPMLIALNIDRSKIPFLLRLWSVLMIGVFAVMWLVLDMIPLAIGATYLVFVAPKLCLQATIARRKTLLRDQLVGATVAMANSTRAGLALAQSLETITEDTPEPLAAEFRRIVYEYQRGRPLAECITDAKTRLGIDSFTLFASAILTSLERGGRITEALERIGASLRENQRLERKLESETASGKMVVWILSAFPFGFLALSFLLNPSGTLTVFQSPFGQMLLCAVLIIVYGCIRWGQKIWTLDI